MNPLPYPSAHEQQLLAKYINDTWITLTRDTFHLLASVLDTKIEETGKRPILYISAQEDKNKVCAQIRDNVGEITYAKIRIETLPAEFTAEHEHGLLYLPGRYVVPGGRFNEFYGWDSYFIQRGLLLGGHTDLAVSLANQALYEVQHYGAVLNANRTYYLTRSQPPVLSMMVRNAYEINNDRAWLIAALPLVENYYYYWRVPPHLNQSTGLSRYHDMGSGPAPEVESSERNEAGHSHYDRILDFLRENDVAGYDKSLYYDATHHSLTPLAYLGDRSMRESGFDPTDRFGALNLDVIHYAPVCLNILLYRMESDIAGFYQEIGDNGSSQIWEERAKISASAMDKYFWNEQAGLYFDYHLGKEEQRIYPFLTTFWPLWQGLASKEQAAKVAANAQLFLAAGGLQTSCRVTGEQWDAPFAWAPLQLLAVEGLERYGYSELAREVARRFTAMIWASFKNDGIICEKYDAVKASSEVSNQITFGYSSNEPGFGWTNAVVLEFLQRYS